MPDNLLQPPPPRRRWFQFRLRTLLIAVAVLAVPIAWVGYALRWIAERHAAIDTGDLHPAWTPKRTVRAPFGMWILGERGYDVLFWVPANRDINDEDELNRLKQLFPEADVDLGESA